MNWPDARVALRAVSTLTSDRRLRMSAGSLAVDGVRVAQGPSFS